MADSSDRIADLSSSEKRELLARLLQEKAAEGESVFPLSFGQQALWFIHKLAPDSVAYNVSFAARIYSEVDIPALRRAFQALVDRHPSLRTTFPARDGQPVQQVHNRVEVHFEETDASTWDWDTLNASMTEEAHYPFDLEREHLFRARFYTHSPTEHTLVATVHHIIGDFWSLGILLNELSFFYSAEQAGEEASLPPLRLQYGDYVGWQNEMLAGPDGERLWQYWQQQLDGDLPVINLPFDRPRPPVQTFEGASHAFNLSEGLIERLKTIAAGEGVTLYMTLLAAFQVLLYRYTGQDDILVGSPVVGRNRAEFEEIVGYFINPVVLRASLSDDLKFTDFLRDVRQTVVAALEHQDYPFALLVERIQRTRDMSQSALFQVMFNMPRATQLEGQAISQLGSGETGVRTNLGGLELELFSVEQRAAMFDLLLAVFEADGALSASLNYNTHLFNADTIERMARHFETLLESIIANPDQSVSSLSLLTDADQHQLLVEFNDSEVDFPRESTFHELFQDQVGRTPDAIVALDEDETVSYQQLNRRANHLARTLVEQGVEPGVVVAVLSERGINLLTAIIAIFKAGGVYLPLTPGYPARRLFQVLDQSKAPLVLAESEFLPVLSEAVDSISAPDRPSFLQLEQLARHEAEVENLPLRCTPDDLAYVIFTSGSTGLPKGAMVEHIGMLNHMYAKILDLDLTDADGVAQNASQSFDISVWQFLAALLIGGRVHIFSDEVAFDPLRLLEEVERQGVTILEIVPSLLRAMLDEVARLGADRPALAALRWLIPTGEALPPELARIWLDDYPDTPLLNAYGPTECSDDVTHYSMFDPPSYDVVNMPIGRPIANMQLYILDSQMQPVPVGVPGELYVGGVGVGRGYLNDAERTNLAFMPDLFSQEPGARMYKTGDLGRFLPDGNIEFLGRVDFQVKVRGFRIELGEIEAVLSQHAGVRETVVLAREDVPGDKRLVAYVVPAGDDEPDVNDLRHLLRERLPDYMIPSAFVFLEALPLTPNGKVDRKVLPAPEMSSYALEDTYEAPRTPTEEKLAELWAEVLGLERVGIRDDFFALGGHSLMAAQLVSRVREEFEIELPLRSLFGALTVAELAQVVEHSPDAAQDSLNAVSVTNLSLEAVLDTSIRPQDAIPYEHQTEAKDILLTGATGFLGAYLLHELLEETQADIHCLVRASDLADGERRLREALGAYALWQESYGPRIKPIAGDLSQPLLGLSNEAFEELAQKLDVIYHNGALVNLTFPYHALKPANVLGTQEIIRLASQVKLKPLHYVSTVSVFSPASDSDSGVVRETDTLDHGEMLYDGYSQSKWVAEKLVSIAQTRGLPVTIHRPGRVAGHSETGISNTDDFLLGLLRDCLRLGSVPDIDILVDMTPVDYVSKAIVHVSRQEASLGKVFHLVNPHPIQWAELVNWIDSSGYPLRRESYDSWQSGVIDQLGGAQAQSMYPLLSLISDMMPEDQLREEIYTQTRMPLFDSRNTLDGLAGTTIACPPVESDLLATYFAFLVESGFLDAG